MERRSATTKVTVRDEAAGGGALPPREQPTTVRDASARAAMAADRRIREDMGKDTIRTSG
ncbi:MAG: hypothetical protein EBU76_05290 [Gammaproteobacteria bacterium]|nr:hypothetical protein [Gammaproteobacteria bacterium]